MEKIKEFLKKRLPEVIDNKNNPFEEETSLVDQNNIDFIIFTNYALRIIKLVIVILNFSYFLGFLFYIYCDISLEIAIQAGVDLEL